MCGRYSIASKLENIEKKFHAHFNYQYQPVYNAAPSLKLPIITQEDPHTIKAFQWGFVPHWETNLNKGYINARGEGIHTNKAFMKSIRERRCLVIANCFYEWRQSKPKVPYLIYCEDQKLFAFAGIYRSFVNKETGEEINTFGIITTGPNPLMDLVKHHRSPVILKQSQWQKWLKAEASLKDITAICNQPYNYKCMNAYPVSELINKPSNNTKEIMQAIGHRVYKMVEVEQKSTKMQRGNSEPKETLGEKAKKDKRQ
jgi:putative SOS response-associated peptidase YedK